MLKTLMQDKPFKYLSSNERTYYLFLVGGDYKFLGKPKPTEHFKAVSRLPVGATVRETNSGYPIVVAAKIEDVHKFLSQYKRLIKKKEQINAKQRDEIKQLKGYNRELFAKLDAHKLEICEVSDLLKKANAADSAKAVLLNEFERDMANKQRVIRWQWVFISLLIVGLLVTTFAV